MTLHDLLAHHQAQLKAVEAYFNTDDTDGKTAKAYRRRTEESRQRVELLERTIKELSV